MKKECVIISSMPVSAQMQEYIPAGVYIIAADAGWQRAAELSKQPNLILGDFDSSPVPKTSAEVMILPAEKDDTDTLFAAKEALRRGFTKITLLGALGGRVDHSIANLQTLLYIAKRGAENLIVGLGVEISCIGKGQTEITAKPNCYLSVFAAGGNAEGVCLKGVKYPLKNATLTPDVPLGVSNEIIGQAASICCECGYLYVMQVQKD